MDLKCACLAMNGRVNPKEIKGQNLRDAITPSSEGRDGARTVRKMRAGDVCMYAITDYFGHVA